jgi:HDOD domain-containing protein
MADRYNTPNKATVGEEHERYQALENFAVAASSDSISSAVGKVLGVFGFLSWRKQRGYRRMGSWFLRGIRKRIFCSAVEQCASLLLQFSRDLLLVLRLLYSLGALLATPTGSPGTVLSLAQKAASEGQRMNPVTYDILTQKIRLLGNLPAIPSILRKLTEALSLEANKINIDAIVEEISYDKSLTAQCLRLANSALFRQRGDVATVREAVFARGVFEIWPSPEVCFCCL